MLHHDDCVWQLHVKLRWYGKLVTMRWTVSSTSPLGKQLGRSLLAELLLSKVLARCEFFCPSLDKRATRKRPCRGVATGVYGYIYPQNSLPLKKICGCSSPVTQDRFDTIYVHVWDINIWFELQWLVKTYTPPQSHSWLRPWTLASPSTSPRSQSDRCMHNNQWLSIKDVRTEDGRGMGPNTDKSWRGGGGWFLLYFCRRLFMDDHSLEQNARKYSVKRLV